MKEVPKSGAYRSVNSIECLLIQRLKQKTCDRDNYLMPWYKKFYNIVFFSLSLKMYT